MTEHIKTSEKIMREALLNIIKDSKKGMADRERGSHWVYEDYIKSILNNAKNAVIEVDKSKQRL